MKRKQYGMPRLVEAGAAYRDDRADAAIYALTHATSKDEMLAIYDRRLAELARRGR